MKRTLLFISLALLLTVSLIAACAKPATTPSTPTPSTPTPAPEPEPQKPITLRMATEWTIGPRTELIDNNFVAPIQERTNGVVTVETYHGGQLVKSTEMMDAISLGTIDISEAHLTVEWPTRVPRLTVLGLSVFDNTDHALRALDGPLGTMLADDLEQRVNTKLLTWLSVGDVDAEGCIKKLIKTPADLKGLKLRVANASDAAACEALGGVPAIISSSEVFLALQRGTVDGVYISSTGGVRDLKLYEVCKNWTRIPIVVGAGYGIVMNNDVWKGLTPEIQGIISEAAIGTQEVMADYFKTEADKTWATQFPEFGVNTYVVPVEDIALWKEPMLGAQKALLEKVVSAEDAKKMLDLIADARQ